MPYFFYCTDNSVHSRWITPLLLKLTICCGKNVCCFGENIKKKQAALNAIAAHCVFKINASFYFFAFLLFTCFSLDFYRQSEVAPTNICVEIWTIWPKKIRQGTCKILCYLFGFIRNEAGQSLIIILTKPTGCLYLRRLCTNERFFSTVCQSRVANRPFHDFFQLLTWIS